MATTTKMTQKSALNFVLTTYADSLPADVKDKLSKMLAQTEKKSDPMKRKPTATQTANEGFKTDILDFMAEGQLYTVTEINKGVPSLTEFSVNKVSALVRLLKDEGLVERIEEKRKAYFRKVDSTALEEAE